MEVNVKFLKSTTISCIGGPSAVIHRRNISAGASRLFSLFYFPLLSLTSGTNDARALVTLSCFHLVDSRVAPDIYMQCRTFVRKEKEVRRLRR